MTEEQNRDLGALYAGQKGSTAQLFVIPGTQTRLVLTITFCERTASQPREDFHAQAHPVAKGHTYTEVP